ncbi:MAG: hypothetical protein GYA62_01830, partial [Bacteroidales bacterium]|nr:hypothetical protein [Bacteroidales bacterium]
MEKIQEILNKVKNVLPFFYNNFENCDFFKATKLINFDYWQKNGLHITPNHFYSPIPDTSKFKNKDFSEKSLVGININIEKQLYMLKLLSKFKTEFNKFKLIKEGVDSQTDSNYYFNNLAFDNVDALSYYGLIRLLKPKKIIEIGSGWSTKIAAQACLENKNTKLF